MGLLKIIKKTKAKEKELQNEVSAKQKTVDDLYEQIKQEKSDDLEGERVRELEKKLKKTELELAGANAVLVHLKGELNEASCSNLSCCVFHLTTHSPHAYSLSQTSPLPSPILPVLPGKGQARC